MTEGGTDATAPAPTVVDVLAPVAVDAAFSYRVPVGMMLACGDLVAVRLGPRLTVGVVWQTGSGRGDNLKPVETKLDRPALQAPLRAFIDWVGRWTLAPRGMVLRMALRASEAAAPEPGRLVLQRAGPPPTRLTPARTRVLETLATLDAPTKRELAAAAGCSAGVIDGLVAEGTLATRAAPTRSEFPRPDPDHAAVTLEPSQAAAATRLVSSVRANRFAVTLLEGVTGSGKTEVYFEAVAAALLAGRQILILLPEIALTTQFLDRFAARFGVRPAEWHSGVGARRRARLWHAAEAGDVGVVVGARSSLFLPFRALGLIVVDEEHEAAYKQDDGVTYNARDMAVVRGRLERAAVVLASATPSVETRVNAQTGRYDHLRLATRIGGRALPAIAAVDLRLDKPPRGRWIAPRLAEAVATTVSRGEQALLFLNRRGYAPLTVCRNCGHRFTCPNCSAWLVEHRFRGALVCHHCGFAERRPEHCPACGEVDALVACGPGVERIAEEAAALFPDARILVLSSDVLGGTEQLRADFGRVARGEVDIVVGTQLVAKGHHFPRLTLAGVLDADVGLASSDPRAAERTFQLIQQVTGRTGRGAGTGRALVQTWQPDHPVIRAVLSGDTERFYATEIASRQRTGMPPFGRLAALIVTAGHRSAAEAHGRALARAAHEAGAPPRDLAHEEADRIDVFGPSEAPVAVIRGRHRFRLLVKANRGADMQGFLRRMLAAAPKPRDGVRVFVDVDPQNFS